MQNPIETANQEALSLMYNADPVLVDVAPASEVMPQLGDGMLLHAGPPVQWPDMCNPMRGAVVGALRYQGWASTEYEAAALASSGSVSLHSTHGFSAVGPMTGIFSPSMPVFVVENRMTPAAPAVKRLTLRNITAFYQSVKIGHNFGVIALTGRNSSFFPIGKDP